jgi:hypothetical protein
LESDLLREKKPVSRIDSKRTHGWFARVYRAKWVGNKSFADLSYGGREVAESAAWKWVRWVEKRLPVIPPKPVLKKATFRMRKNEHDRYYDVYLPSPGKGKPQFRRLYFNVLADMQTQGENAYRLVQEQNVRLLEAYQLSYVAWKRAHDRIMQEILSMWEKAK